MRRLVIVEPDQSYCTELTRAFERVGYQVASTSRLLHAQDLVATEDPDAVIVTTRLADGSAVELAHELRDGGLPAVLLCSDAAAMSGLRAKGEDFVAKPVKADRLVRLVNSLVGPLPIRGSAQKPHRTTALWPELRAAS